MTKEQLKLQKRAGILTESEYKAKLEKISKPLNESIGGVISLGIIGDVKDPIDYFFGKKYLNEASFTDMMEPEAKEIYREYIQKIDIFGDREIQDHKALDMALKSDPRFKEIRQKQLLQRALGWYITQAQEMER